MAQDIVEMSKDLVMGLIRAGVIKPEDMQSELQKTHATLAMLKAREEGMHSDGDTLPSGAGGLLDWRKSIKKHSVECLVCGAVFKQLSTKHLSTHDLDPRTYRQRFGIPGNQPLSAKATTALRREVVQKIRPWEKAPTYVKGQESEAASEPAAIPKRARKKTVARSA